MSRVGIFGEGITQGRPVCAKSKERDHPVTGVTVKATGLARKRALKRRASSPTVIPWRMGIGWIPTNDTHSGASNTGPSSTTPPSGLGLSSTSSGMPCSAQASMALERVPT